MAGHAQLKFVTTEDTNSLDGAHIITVTECFTGLRVLYNLDNHGKNVVSMSVAFYPIIVSNDTIKCYFLVAISNCY